MPQASERRASPRCGAIGNRSCILLAIPMGLRRIESRLINISREGALIATESPPPCETRVSVRVENPVKMDWVEAIIVRADCGRQVGVRFTDGSGR